MHHVHLPIPIPSIRHALLVALLLSTGSTGSPGVVAAAGEGSAQTIASRGTYSPVLRQEFPANVYWGDTHLHTRLSVDANNSGNKRLGPDEAFRFARGEEVTAHNGMRVRLRRPLDFLVIADHAEYLGLLPGLEVADPILLKTEYGKRWYEMSKVAPGTGQLSQLAKEIIVDSFIPAQGRIASDEFERSVWHGVIANADRHNDAGRFTAFIGYEWTSMIEADNLHRVVIFKDGADRAGQVLPFSAFDSPDPEALWAFMADYEKRTGGEILAIPHNGNGSNGLMFAPRDFRGRPFTREYVRTRGRWEPLYEVTQTKGDAEAHPLLSPGDEFADYETWDRGNLLQTKPKEDWMLQFEYARPALKLGLELEAQLGTNPFKFGLIGSTDAHTGLATAAEDNYWGKVTTKEPSPDRWTGKFFEAATAPMYSWELAASGLAAVWADENSRDALFHAMRRRETYATTGPRMLVRFFGGWDFEPADAHRPDLAAVGYRKGVPMGGDLTQAPEDKAPTFLVRAVKDPDSANLDRVQMIKGWRSESGELEEKVYEVALSGGRKVGRDGLAPPVGSTVEIESARYSNSIGAPELAAVWRDPSFDPAQRAFYYVRVIEIPTPRWTAYDAAFFGIEMDDEVPMSTQERAYTSPIWYTP
ncbi:MAG: DUF3604 domain-containing protein [Deltaproteobacteria bacterium]|nr:DUF3604 domain-containing protein [Deltaproteobacteria bacterium]